MWKLYIVNILLIGFLQLGIISNSAHKWLIMLIHKKKNFILQNFTLPKLKMINNAIIRELMTLQPFSMLLRTNISL